MTDKEKARLEAKIRDLEAEVEAREADLKAYKKDLVETNKKLELIISNLSREIRIVMNIQKLLMPTSFPHIKGIDFSYKFIPSTVSGGDYFDIFEHKDKFKFGILMASGSGHGMSSLLLSVILKMSGQLEAKKGDDPHKVIEFIYEELKSSLSPNDNADIFYGVVNRRTFELHYCLLGQLDFYLLRSDGRKLELLKPDGPALAANMKATKKSRKLMLDPSDRMILCTRGVVQSKNLEGEEFGTERLAKSILSAPDQGAHELRNEILLHIKKHSEGLKPQRDQTVLIAEVKERIIKSLS